MRVVKPWTYPPPPCARPSEEGKGGNDGRTCAIHSVGITSALYTFGYHTSNFGPPTAAVEVEIYDVGCLVQRMVCG